MCVCVYEHDECVHLLVANNYLHFRWHWNHKLLHYCVYCKHHILQHRHKQVSGYWIYVFFVCVLIYCCVSASLHYIWQKINKEFMAPHTETQKMYCGLILTWCMLLHDLSSWEQRERERERDHTDTGTVRHKGKESQGQQEGPSLDRLLGMNFLTFLLPLKAKSTSHLLPTPPAADRWVNAIITQTLLVPF